MEKSKLSKDNPASNPVSHSEARKISLRPGHATVTKSHRVINQSPHKPRTGSPDLHTRHERRSVDTRHSIESSTVPPSQPPGNPTAQLSKYVDQIRPKDKEKDVKGTIWQKIAKKWERRTKKDETKVPSKIIENPPSPSKKKTERSETTSHHTAKLRSIGSGGQGQVPTFLPWNFTNKTGGDIVGGQGDKKKRTDDAREIKILSHDVYIVDDPQEIHSWVMGMTKKLYLYWVLLIILACLLNAVIVYCFVLMDHVYAFDFFGRILLYGEFNKFGIVGTTLAIMVIATWGCFSSTTPMMPKVTRINKWTIWLLLELYIVFCIITQLYECGGLREQLKSVMVKDITLPVHSISTPSRLETVTQVYYDCCGIENYNDWVTMGHLNRSRRSDLRGGFPQSCCKREFPNCTVPVLLYSADHENMIQLWIRSCLNAEYLMIILVLVFVILIESFCVISSVIAGFVLRKVLNHMVEHNVEHMHPFA